MSDPTVIRPDQCTRSLAPSVLLDCALAIGAFFRVALDPIGSLAVVMTLL